MGLISDVTTESGREIVHRIDCWSGFHGWGSIQQSPVAALCELDEECFEEHLGELLSHAHARASTERDVVEPRGVLGRLAHEALWTEVLLVGENVCDVVGVTDAIDDVPSLWNLVAL